MQPHGCGVTTMTAHTWHWAAWPPSRAWLWLH